MSELIVETCQIEKVEKHPNADKLDLVTIKGWQCIVGREQYKVGDIVIYCPPDSVIPEIIIDKYNLEYLKKNGRVGVVKLRGYISEGLILDIPKELEKKVKVGQDCSKLLGITKYEPPAPKYQQYKTKETIHSTFLKYKEGKITFRRFMFKCFGVIKDKFKKKKNINPNFHKYTDINNIKNYSNIFEPDDIVVITEKVHGTNIRAGYVPTKINRWLFKHKNQEFCYGSHNVQITGNKGRQCWYGEDIYGQIAERYKLAEILPKDYIIYGEIYGAGIQKNYEYGLKNTIDVVFFDIKKEGKYIDYNEFEAFCIKNNLPITPKLYCGKFKDIDNINNYIEGKSMLYSTQKIREGCVIKTAKEEFHPRIGRKILKCINPDYLLIKDRTDFH